MNIEMAQRLDAALYAKGNVIWEGPGMVLREYCDGSTPVLLRWEHLLPFGPAPFEIGYYGVECSGVMALSPLYGDAVWTIEQAEPLTLSPSMSCTTCGSYGQIVNGKWEGHVPLPSPEEGQRRELRHMRLHNPGGYARMQIEELVRGIRSGALHTVSQIQTYLYEHNRDLFL